jgi:hypothetical protein
MPIEEPNLDCRTQIDNSTLSTWGDSVIKRRELEHTEKYDTPSGRGVPLGEARDNSKGANSHGYDLGKSRAIV